MAGTGMRAPLFERLASSEAESTREFDRQDLLDSVHAELGRLFNTRRGPLTRTTPASVIDYGIADWSALQQQRSDDRRRLARDIREAIMHFEPRLLLGEVQVNPLPEHPQRMSIRLLGELRSGQQHWPVAFVIEPGGEGLEVRDERLD
jgi:type VI secretion system lysozyme-related protein